ncbi:MAG: hypothetical protein GY835_18585 [bacterium]|nr:hypothetical protein [bacterium]
MWKRTKINRPKTLRSSLAEQIDRLADTAVESDGEIPEKGIADVERLARLCILLERKRRRTWSWIFTVLFVGLTLCAPLGFLRLSSTGITLDVISSSVSFRLREELSIIQSATLTTVDASAARNVELPLVGNDGKRRLGHADGDRFTIQVDQQHAPEGTAIGLSGLRLPKGTVLSIDKAAENRSVRLVLLPDDHGPATEVPAPITMNLSVVDHLLLRASAGAPVPCTYEQPSAIAVELAKPPLQLDLIPLLPTSILLASNFRIDKLDLVDRRETLPELGVEAHHVSQIREGELIIEGIKGDSANHRLRDFEPLTLRGVNGVIQRAELTDDGISILFRGTVEDLTTGVGEYRRDLMPTWVEWFNASKPLLLVGYVVILFLSFMLNLRQLTNNGE